MNKEFFKVLISNFIQKELDGYLPRNLQLPTDSRKVVCVTGARRTGKSSALLHLIYKLRKEKDRANLIYINFEDDRLYPHQLSHLNEMLEAYYELFPDKRSETVYFFLDEIQVVPKWELFVRRVYDQEDCRLYLTGSSSTMLSREIASSLRGRSVSFQMDVLSFDEFVRFQGEEVKNVYNSANQTRLRNLFNLFLKQGGFPELCFTELSAHRVVLQEYLDTMLFKDMVERYQVSNPQFMKLLLKYLVVNTARPLSVNKLHNTFRSMGYSISKDRLYEYVGYLEESYLASQLTIFSENILEQNRNPKKFYIIDHALKYVFKSDPEPGQLLEQLVFKQLSRHHDEISYSKGKFEQDFVCRSGAGMVDLVNVCHELHDPDTRSREIRSLEEGMQQFDLNDSLLITADHEEELVLEEGRKIKMVPFWKWAFTQAKPNRPDL